MKIKDVIESFNKKTQKEDVEDTLWRIYEEDVEVEQKQISNHDKHRWYELANVVYEVFYKKESIGFMSVNEVITMFSEADTLEDIYHTFRVKEVFPVEKMVVVYE